MTHIKPSSSDFRENCKQAQEYSAGWPIASLACRRDRGKLNQKLASLLVIKGVISKAYAEVESKEQAAGDVPSHNTVRI